MRKVLLPFLAILVGLTGAWIVRRTMSAHTIEVTHPSNGEAVQAIYATGTVEGTVMFPIAPRVSARLLELAVDEGDTVTEGQTLAKFEDEDMREAVRELDAREKRAKDELERQRELFSKRVAAKQDLDRAVSEWEAAHAATKAAGVRADYLTLSAPAAGQIIRRDGEVGELVAVDRPVFWMMKEGPLRISAEVDEEDISVVKPGQEVLIRGDAFPNSVFHGEVQSITPKGDPIQRSYRVRIQFRDNAPFKIGMTAENNIIVRRKDNALLVPSSAVAKNQMWLVQDGRLKKVTVAVGAKGVTQTEILSGVSLEDLVVIQPTAEFSEGAKVKTVLRKPVE